MRNLFDGSLSGVSPLNVGEDGGKYVMTSDDDRKILHIVASIGGGWDHVSISRPERTPTWAEMEQVKRAFFHDHEVAVQYHVPPADHISHHPFCLHLWRPQNRHVPRPPAEYVA